MAEFRTTGPARIDAHQHYWDPRRGDYSWMPAEGVLARSYLPGELAPQRAQAGISGTVLVQAAPTVAETRWLLDLAGDHESGVRGVVGWVDLEAPDVEPQLDAIGSDLLVGIRPMIQDIPDDAWILRRQVLRGLRALERRGLAFDLLGYTRHLAHAVRALEQVPDLTVVVDHLMKPDYSVLAAEWTAGLTQLASRPRSFMKISGLATEVRSPPEPGLFARHVDFALEAFGPARCMLGTDWPVCTLALPYQASVGLLERLVRRLPADERRAVWLTACQDAYRLPVAGQGTTEVRK
jgi:L-fuconolactonase